MSLSPGRRLGTYEVLGPLGAGGMGEVWRARDSKLGREVALKVLPDALAADPDRMARFQREARLLASLNHAAIATIHGLEEADGVRFLVLELVPGATLAERLSGGPLPMDEALRIGVQVAEALDAAHRGGVVHRDLKPSNVKVTPGGKVKVLDFGLAKALGPQEEGSPIDTTAITQSQTSTAVGTVLGTLGYMSPEQTRGRPVDEATDLWGLGCLLYEMLSGRPCFLRDSVADSLAAIVDREPDWDRLPGRLPSTVRRLLQASLEKESGSPTTRRARGTARTRGRPCASTRRAAALGLGGSRARPDRGSRLFPGEALAT